RDLIVTGVQTCALPISVVDHRVQRDAVVGPGSGRSDAVAEVAAAEVQVELLQPVVADLTVDGVGPKSRSGAGRTDQVVVVRGREIGRASCRERRGGEGG